MKKTIILCATLTVFIFSTCSEKMCKDENCAKSKSTIEQTSMTLPDTATLVCKLTSAELMKRSEELKATLFEDYEKLNETEDAVELVYADSKKYAPLLVEFINSERECCPFFTFTLKFEPNSEKVSITIGGSPRIKEMIKSFME